MLILCNSNNHHKVEAGLGAPIYFDSIEAELSEGDEVIINVLDLLANDTDIDSEMREYGFRSTTQTSAVKEVSLSPVS